MRGAWHEHLAGFDLETTGVDVESARIVTAALVDRGPIPARPVTWVADPGVEIPAGAAKLHGYTTERARAEGISPEEVVGELVALLATYADEGVPVVAMNATYDFTVLDREARRHGITPLVDLVGDRLWVVDPWVLDRKLDRYRRGGRTLEDLCRHYRVPLGKAHDAAADAVAAVDVVRAIVKREPVIGTATPEFLHDRQADWARVLADDRAAYFARTPGKEHRAAGVLRDWPLVPFRAEGVPA
ncbi:exonuclease domain-containing protein [Actinacidiphila sp. DG2A-62]|uniref:exonuclease domain-containing protein n=1 Tax=Actinacidiphila sp. DG2A-62 TaxID=3108821 RepID=UPI002DBB5DC8|nr:exonuclease domain-containing protein [Actinacidiphila sp. DG2A-62]MEC3995069.1 exonuclease domain-containing protein [Actinacidiphila sp. DG2A-62]